MSETQVTTEVQFEATDDLDAFAADFFGQKEAVTEPASSEVEQEKQEQTSEEVTEAQVAEPETKEEVDEETQKPKNTVQARIDELVRQRHEAERVGEARLEALRREFEEKLAALQPKPPEKKSAEPTPTDQNEDGSDKYPLGEFDPAYIRDLTRFTLEQERTQVKVREEAERKQRETDAQQAALTASWNEKLEPAKVQYPDFQEKGEALVNQFSNLDQGYAQYLTSLLMQMDKGPDVLYYLASNPAEAVSIVNSGAQRATLALGRIEAKFIEADAQKQAAKPRVSKAPPPPPVQSRGTAAGHLGVEPDTDDLDLFAKEFFKKKR